MIEAGEFTRAAHQLEEVLKDSPGNAAAHNDLGVLQFRSGDHTGALAHMLQALRLEPANTAYAENIVDVCRTLGLDQQASEMEALLARQKHGKDPAQVHRVVGGIDFDALRSQPVTDRQSLIAWYWSAHPRFRFLKCVPPDAKILDVGAGGGGLVLWKEWLEPRRPDLMLYAVDQQKAELFDRYTGYQICNLDQERLQFEREFFDGAILSHVLEHIADPGDLLKSLRGVMKTGGQMYIEVPTLESMDFPSRTEFASAGIPVSTVNFFDDSTHRRTFGLGELRSLTEAAGYRIIETGTIRNRFVEDTLMIQGAAHKDEELSTYGIWSRLGFAHYVIVEAL